ncbi:neuroendocrine convertase 2 [Octopus bimaculoides]|nr:neuroendocrine convertase 2 [Octopus bimaculoides]
MSLSGSSCMRNGKMVAGLLMHIFLLFILCQPIAEVQSIGSDEVITNSWYVQLHGEGGIPVAKELAKRSGFTYISPILSSNTEFHFKHRAVPHARKRRSLSHTRSLKTYPQVKFAVQQSGYVRQKRGFKPLSKLIQQEGSVQVYPQLSPKLRTVDKRFNMLPEPTDPFYPKQWYLKNNGQSGGIEGLDLNVNMAWSKGFTGKNITTAIMDDGIDYLHEDLRDNYNADASFDFSSHDPFPYPRYTDTWFNSHGTRCAGEVAAKRDNSKCGVGVAYDSKVAGLRMLDQPYMTDMIEANAMGYKPNEIDIYSASWGPTDDGMTVDGPRNLTMRAIVEGVNKGRNGKGSIYVWASGDGGPNDDCNCDGYAASMWTISINSATNDGQTAAYDESCSSTLASTFSNGKGMTLDAGVTTTDLYDKCTTTHSGTSAAAPEAAGVFALALEANYDLTWRDMQHLSVLTSKRRQLYDASSHHHWTTNGAGLQFNHLFGYGVLDASDIVDMAQSWKPLPERLHCDAGNVTGKWEFRTGEHLQLTIDTDACKGTGSEINFLEHVQAVITLKASYRGHVEMFLTSPMNTTSMILSRRPRDADNKNGFKRWPFMTTHTWAENPRGRWTLTVRLNSGWSSRVDMGVFSEWTLMLHGTKISSYTHQLNSSKNHKLDTVKRMHMTGFQK